MPTHPWAAEVSRHLLRLLAMAPMSMTDLSLASGTGSQTLRRELAQLLDGGWIAEVGTDNTTGGRPARIYGLDGSTHLLVGVHLEIPTLRVALVGLDGVVLDQRYLECSDTASPLEVMRLIVEQIGELVDGYPGRRFVGVGVAAPGFLHPETGGLLSVGRQPQWDNFPIRDHLEAELGMAVTIANDVDCMAHEEFVPGGQEEPDTVYVGYGEGVKASLWLDGRPYHGRLSNAGLIGAMTVMGAEGRLTPLQEVSSIAAVCTTYSRVADPEVVDQGRILDIADRAARFRAILDAAAAGQEPAAGILDAALDALAQGLANAAVLLQPRLMVIGGALVELDDARWSGLQDAIRAQVHPLIGHQLWVRRARRTSDLAAALGAAKLALQGVDPGSVATAVGRRQASVH